MDRMLYLPGPIPDIKVHGTHLGPTWILSAPDGPHVGPMNFAFRDGYEAKRQDFLS